MKLSKRLQAILDLIDKTEVLVDVGCDHAYVIIQAIIENKCQKAYGLDIASGPLSYAQRNIQEHDLQDKISLMQMDGLKDFKEKGDTFVIAGMGFETMISILDAYDFNESQTLILQSNTKIYDLRKALNHRGFLILDETFLYDNAKPITILKVNLQKQDLVEKDFYLGPILPNKINHDYLDYLLSEYRKMKHVVHYNKDYQERFLILEAYLTQKGVL